MRSDPPDPGRAALLLRQRHELGGGSVFLDALSREEALALLARARAAGQEGASGPPGSPPDGARGPGSRPPAPGSRAAPGAAPAGSSVRRAAPAAAAGSSARGADGAPAAPDLSVLPAEYEALRELALGCTRCALSRGRTQVVFSDGNPSGRLMVIGEAPGQREDERGLPFVGPAGKLLDLLLATIDLSRRDSVYIANVLKCRPPGNRNPEPPEIEQCTPFLRRQIELVRPEALLGVGTFAAQFLTGSGTSIGRLRGRVHSYQDVPVVVTYHPAALLRNAGWIQATWDDLQLLRQVLDGA